MCSLCCFFFKKKKRKEWFLFLCLNIAKRDKDAIPSCMCFLLLCSSLYSPPPQLPYSQNTKVGFA